MKLVARVSSMPSVGLHLRRGVERRSRVRRRLLSSQAAEIAEEEEEGVRDAVRRLQSLYDHWGGGHYTIGEPLTILQHSAQAGLAARRAGERPEVIVGALLHDVGHLLGFEAGLEAEMDGCGFEGHDVSGGEFLRGLGFSEDVAYLVAQHVPAKRYRVAVDSEYASKLSKASRITLSFQGGPMTQTEIDACDADPRWPDALRLRDYDEAAKLEADFLNVSATEILFQEFWSEIKACFDIEKAKKVLYLLSPEQLRKWDKDGTLAVPGFSTGLNQPKKLDEMASFLSDPEHPIRTLNPKSLIHRELIQNEPTICRVENFVKYEPRWRRVSDLVTDLVSQLYREQALLFKDKINFKPPGGAGFLWHQDATAYATDDLASSHISALVAVDEATIENGALQIVPATHNLGIFPHEHGVICNSVINDWPQSSIHHVLTQPGDIVLFDSYLPHKSDTNNSQSWRRMAYLTYNKASEGDFHADYYKKKAELIQKGAISINLDFAGKIVD